METLEEQFQAKVDKSGECWLWTGYALPKGYGQFWCHGKLHYVHRLAYELSFGPIAAGMEIDHRCHNRGCVNPEHLRAVTRKQNTENRAGAMSNSKSGVRGVSWHAGRRKWAAKVRHNGRDYALGHFLDIKAAETAVIAKRNELFTHNDLDRKAS